jgi:hypothetical protein
MFKNLAILTFVSIAFCQPSDVDPRFHTPDEMMTEFQALELAHPNICDVETVGYSTADNEPIIVVKLSDNVHTYERESAALFVAGQHAREVLGTEAAIKLVNYLVTNYGTNPDVTAWLDSFQIWIMPINNPEGRNIIMQDTPDHTLGWRKNKHDNNDNGIFDEDYDGVDPNRNYEYTWAEYEVTQPESVEYKGETPFSENESRAVKALVDSLRPTVVVDLHSPDVTGGNKLWFCWWDPSVGSSGAYHKEGYPHYLYVAQGLAKATITETDTQYIWKASYNTIPKMQTWCYWYSGTCAMLMEITNQCFWTGDTIDTIATRVERGLTYLLDRMTERGLIVDVADSVTGLPLRAEVVIDNVTDTTFPERLCARNGRFHRLLQKGFYNVHVKYATIEKVFDSVPIDTFNNTHINVRFDLTSVSEKVKTTETALMLAKNKLIVKIAGDLSLFDITGKCVMQKQVAREQRIYATELTDGVYFVRLTDRKSNVFKKKLTAIGGVFLAE